MENEIAPGFWDLTLSPAEIHERYLVPAVYAQWAIRMTHLAEIDAGCRVLDVGCGTGILARKAVEEVGFNGRVCGLDSDPQMLALAERQTSVIDWLAGDAGCLPFHDASFDRVLSQFMLPYVRNRMAVVREMWRVLQPGGRLLLAVWAPLHSAPAFNVLVHLIAEHAGQRAAELAALPWDLGFDSKLSTLLDTAGIRGYALSQHRGTARFPGIPEMLEVWVRSSPVGQRIGEARYRNLCAAALEELRHYLVAGGAVVSPLNTRVVTAIKR